VVRGVNSGDALVEAGRDFVDFGGGHLWYGLVERLELCPKRASAKGLFSEIAPGSL
jgi:hypothetical protein